MAMRRSAKILVHVTSTQLTLVIRMNNTVCTLIIAWPSVEVGFLYPYTNRVATTPITIRSSITTMMTITIIPIILPILC